MIRESARAFSEKEIAPRAAAIDRDNLFPRDLWPKMGALGLTRDHRAGGVRGLGAGLSRALRCDGGSLARLGFRRPLLWRAFEPLRQPDRPQRQRAAEGALPAEAHLRRACRRARDVRAERRLRRRVDDHARREEGRPLCPQWRENVDHQRPGRRDARRLRQDRSRGRRARHHRLYRRARHEGLLAGAEARQARHARIRHLRARLLRLRDAGRECAGRRRQGRQRADERPRLRARGALRRAARPHAGGARRRACPMSTSASSSASRSACSSSSRASSPTCM